MCGICGISVNPNASPDKKATSVRLFKALLTENTSRGKDSTGIVYLNPEHSEVCKGLLPGRSAQDFVFPERDFSGLMGHTRFATIGSKTDYANIHPFETPNLIGVHNGTIFNHEWLREYFELETIGTCDSEVVYQLIDRYGLDHLKYVIGTYMLAYVHNEDPTTVHLITNGSKPLHIFKDKGNFIGWGSVAMSTIRAFRKGNPDFELDEFKLHPCTHYVFKDGECVGCESMTDTVQYMSEPEGKLRFKVDFKIRRLYTKTIPMDHRLPKPKPKTTSVTTTTSSRSSGSITESSLFPKGDDHTSPELADILTKFWMKERILNFKKLWDRKMRGKGPKVTHVAVNMDTLGKLFYFDDPKDGREWYRKFCICPGKNSTKDVGFFTVPIVGTFPEDTTNVHRYWIPNLMEIEVFLSACMFADDVTLYSTETKIPKKAMPTAPELLASTMAGIMHPEARKAILKTFEIDFGFINSDIVRLADGEGSRSDLKKRFSTGIKETEAVVFSKRNPILNPFAFGGLRKMFPYSWRTVESAFEAHNIHPKFLPDVGVTMRGHFYIVLLAGLLERTALGAAERVGVKYSGDYNPLRTMMTQFVSQDDDKEFDAFYKRIKNFKERRFCTGVRHDLEAGEYAALELFTYMFDCSARRKARSLCNLHSHAHELQAPNTKSLVRDVALTRLARVVALRDFAVNGEVPKNDKVIDRIKL